MKLRQMALPKALKKGFYDSFSTMRTLLWQLGAKNGYFWCFSNILTSLRSFWRILGALGAFGTFLAHFLAFEDALSRISTLKLQGSPRHWGRTCRTVQENKRNSNWSYLYIFDAKDPRQQCKIWEKRLMTLLVIWPVLFDEITWNGTH